MILHIAPDEKFIDTGFRIFEDVSPKMNKLIVVSGEDKVIFVKKTPFDKCSINELQSKSFIEYLKNFTAVVFHSLRFLNVNVPPGVNVLWIGFGYDYYDLICKNRIDLFLPKTLLLEKSLNKNTPIKNIVKKSSFFRALNRRIKGQTSKLDAINKIDFFAPVLNSEFDLISNAVSNFKPEFIDWNYGTLEDDFLKGFQNRRVSGNNILIGNSASYENNHLEAFDLLNQLDINNKNLICPLSYGVDEYRDEICSIGNEVFSGKFHGLTGFMPIEEYINILSSCSIVIMNHIRQQALGNIIIMLYLGAKVFLREENPVYVFFKKEGATVYSIQEMEKNHSLINAKMTEKELVVNREILVKHWSRKTIQEKTRLLVNKITS